ncbi:LysR family transcriptional regulator [Rhodospirillaceae bacterium SYSU D60014]|uniref:LysR family transcriptional regulator n=1 Tax=Virgifigura deserti TaxID=2268457 RepID=UPI000E668420
MNLRSLRTFVTIADTGGVHRAAARLNLSQPALSRQIRALEIELGVPLFDRIGRRVQLTSEGEDLLRRSRQLLSDADSLVERADALKKGETGILRIGATPQVIENTLAPFLGHYRRRHPAIEVQLVEDGGVRLPDRLANGDVQLVLTVVIDERFRQRLLYPGYGIAVLSTKHRLSQRRTIDVEELADEPLLLLHRTFASREWLDTACNAAHIRPRVLLESAAPHTIIALAGAEYGIAIIPSTVTVPRGNIWAALLTQRGVPLGRWLTVGWDAHRFLAPYAEQFVEELVAYCDRYYPGREFTKRAPLPPRPREAIWTMPLTRAMSGPAQRQTR